MKKKPTKPSPSRDSERETRVLLEEVRSDFKLLAEQYSSITKKLKEHDREFFKIHGRFDTLEKQFGAILTDHEHRLKTVEQKLEIA